MRIVDVQSVRVKRQWRVRVTLEDGTERLIWPETQIQCDIHAGDNLSPEQWKTTMVADDSYGSRVKSLRLLSVRPRSAEELRQRLQSEGFLSAAIDACIRQLQDEGYLDDADFARRFARTRLIRKPMGPRALEYELRKKGIAESLRQRVIAELLPDDVELELAEKTAQQKLKSYREKDRRVLERKLSAYLAQRGFTGETVRAVIKRIL